ncbi:MAG TPA: hypothetical protein VK902_01410 [Rubrobacter sp.]|nr:hypothetical protein [Rubrobacter sp.]
MDLNERIEAGVEASGTTLTEIFGVGPILAAKRIEVELSSLESAPDLA